MVAIVIILMAVAGVMFSGFAQDSLSSSKVHGTGSYSADFNPAGNGYLQLRPESVQTRDTTFYLRINDHRAYEWDGASRLKISCLMPDDRIRIITEKGETTNILYEHTLDQALKCQLNLLERFEYVIVHDGGSQHQIKIGSEYNFDLAIDPDGAGTDTDTYTTNFDNGKQTVGPIPLSNQWHYRKQFNKELEGLGGPDTPVYLYIMADNVHWASAPDISGVPNSGSLNWTDPPPDGHTPGQGNYHVSGHDLIPDPDGGVGEPTNDIYMLFEPGCDESRILIAEENAGYDNDILMDGEIVVDNTNTAEGTILTAPAIPCFEG